jgi:flagellar assembly factor FliW
MPVCQTKYHGALRFEPHQVLNVPGGLFGFPEEKEFILLELPSMRPLAFVQSIRTTDLCFVALPAQVIDPGYQLHLQTADIEAFGYTPDQPPTMGHDLLCLALLTMREQQETTANLLAPLIIDISRHHGMQVLVEGGYSHEHPIPAGTTELTPSC